MQIDYDPQADARYIRFRDGQVDDTLTINQYIYADIDRDGLPIGLEILFARQVLATNDLTQVIVNIGRTHVLTSPS